MNKLAATALSMSLAAAPAIAQEEERRFAKPGVSIEQGRSVSPALEKYTQENVLNGLWQLPGLSPRDRSVISVAALIARNQQIEMPFHFNRALDNGVTPVELSEIITHLAFYSGWANAMTAVQVASDVYAARGISADQLPEATPTLLPVNEALDEPRAAGVSKTLVPFRPV